MDYSRKRWWILAANCFINLCVGSMYAWSIFASPMAEYLSGLHGSAISSANLAIVFVVCNSVGPITMITGGKINDTLGPKLVIFIGGLMFGGGMILCGYATEVSHLVWAYGILTGLGLGMVYGATISTSIKFFPDKRGFVGGITTALFGISSVIIPPIAAWITAEAGILAAFKIIGLIFAVIVCACAFVMDKCPDGFTPAGWQAAQGTKSGGISLDKNWRQMLCTPNFYLMLVMLTCGAVAGLMCISLASPLARLMIGMSTAAATLAVSVLALFNVLGRVLAGVVSDKIGRINTLMLACILSLPGLYLLYLAGPGDNLLFYVGISIIGLCFGAFMGVFPGFTADQFGARFNSVNFGIMFCGFAIAGYVGPTIMSATFASSHSYKAAFPIGMAFSVAALLLALIFRATNKHAQFQ
ncbi:L-lactate MFS transporter [Kluyvera sichuanensis]